MDNSWEVRTISLSFPFLLFVCGPTKTCEVHAQNPIQSPTKQCQHFHSHSSALLSKDSHPMAAARQLLHLSCTHQPTPTSSPPQHVSSATAPLWLCGGSPSLKSLLASSRQVLPAPRASPGIVPADGDDDDGVSLGTMKLPSNTDIPRFETLLFQWANSLCQGANLPLPVPLKVDKIQGGARLGFITVDDGKTEVCVYIDCLVFPATASSGPLFRAVRNGPLKDKAPPGEPRIMRSLLQALERSTEIARI